MRRDRFRARLPGRRLLAAALAASAALSAAPAPGAATDMMALPPLTREAVSPDERWIVEVARPEEFRPGLFPTVTIRPAEAEAEAVGRRELRYPLGPRFVFALDDGRAVLVDEWLRRFDTENAILVLDADGEVLARFSAADVRAVAEQDAETVKAAARFGPWLADRPRIEPDRGALALPVGRARVALDLDTLRLRREDA